MEESFDQNTLEDKHPLASSHVVQSGPQQHDYLSDKIPNTYTHFDYEKKNTKLFPIDLEFKNTYHPIVKCAKINATVESSLLLCLLCEHMTFISNPCGLEICNVAFR